LLERLAELARALARRAAAAADDAELAQHAQDVRAPGRAADLEQAPEPAPPAARPNGGAQLFRAVALPPLRPAAFFCAVVPPCDASPPEPDRLPPCSDDFGAFAILAARSLDMPLSLRASYFRSFLMLGRFFGIARLLGSRDHP